MKSTESNPAITETHDLNKALAESCFRARTYKQLTQAQLAEKVKYPGATPTA